MLVHKINKEIQVNDIHITINTITSTKQNIKIMMHISEEDTLHNSRTKTRV